MHFKGADLNLLVALEALLSERSVTKAAERLHVTQPAMSNALRRIRDIFEDEILVKSGRGLDLSPAAHALLIPVRDILHRSELLLNATKVFNPRTAQKTFRITMSDYCADVLLPFIVRSLNEEAPGIRLEVGFLRRDSLQRLATGDLDFSISPSDLRLLDPEFDSSEIKRLPLFSDSFECLVWDESPICAEGLSKHNYLNSKHASVRFGMGSVSADEQVKRQMGLETVAIVPSVGTLPKIIRGTNLVATVPSLLLKTGVDLQGLKVFPCPIKISPFEENLLWHYRTSNDPSHMWFVDIMKRAVGGQLLAP